MEKLLTYSIQEETPIDLKKITGVLKPIITLVK